MIINERLPRCYANYLNNEVTFTQERKPVRKKNQENDKNLRNINHIYLSEINFEEVILQIFR